MKKNFIFTLVLLITVLLSTRSFAQVDTLLENKEYRNGYIPFAVIVKKKQYFFQQ